MAGLACGCHGTGFRHRIGLFCVVLFCVVEGLARGWLVIRRVAACVGRVGFDGWGG